MMEKTYTAVPYVVAGAGGSSTNEVNANYQVVIGISCLWELEHFFIILSFNYENKAM